MHRLHLVHWKMDEAEARALEFENAGFEVEVESDHGKAILRNLRAKKPDVVVSDLTQAEVRSLGLSNGLVDYKVCAIDSTWSGLKFAIRK